jgi:hypothetical protein
MGEVTHMHPCKGLDVQKSKLIKLARTCGNCHRSYLQDRSMYAYAHGIKACRLHNCKVNNNEWCKHHKLSLPK